MLGLKRGLTPAGAFSLILSVVIGVGYSPTISFAGGPDETAAQNVDPDFVAGDIWEKAKRLYEEGNYAESLLFINKILTLHPDDAWANLYKEMCRVRLQEDAPIEAISPDGYRTLRERLEEESDQRSEIRGEIEQERRRHEEETKQWRKQIQSSLEKNAVPPEPPKSAPPEKPDTAPVQQASAMQPAEKIAVEKPSISSENNQLPSTASPAVGTPSPEMPSDRSEREPVQINADQMRVTRDQNRAVAEGNVEVLFDDGTMWCDELVMFTDTGDVYAQGGVRMKKGNQEFRAEHVHYNYKTKKGRFLQGTVYSPPWYEHGSVLEHIAEGVYQVSQGHLTSCSHDPPHYRFSGGKAIAFADDNFARARNVSFKVADVPLLYLPWVSFSKERSPFFVVPGKRKPWGFYVLSGYKQELGEDEANQVTYKVDYRENFDVGVGLDYEMDSKDFGKGLFKIYYNHGSNATEPPSALPKGADGERYRVLWRHQWQPTDDTTVITDIQEYSDRNFRQDFLFREEVVEDNRPESFISVVKSTDIATYSGLVRKRLNRFDAVDEVLPQLTANFRQQRIGDTWLFSETRTDFANFQSKTPNSDVDADVVRFDLFQKFRYAFSLLAPLQLTPNVAVRQTYYTKDAQGASREGKQDFVSGQFSTGMSSSIKFFRIFDVKTNKFGLNIDKLRHILTPTVEYRYVHEPTVPNSLLTFPAASAPTNLVEFGLLNKFQTKRLNREGYEVSVDLARVSVDVPYTFAGSGNSAGGQLGDWQFKVEMFPYSWMRIESNWTYPSQFNKGSRDRRLETWNLDMVMVGGTESTGTSNVSAPAPTGYEQGREDQLVFMPLGQWALGFGHRYSQNDKTETVAQFDWRLSEKWQVGTFNRFTWKEVASGNKRFNHLREYQYSLRRDLHDWVGELVYRVDRELGEEIFFLLTLKAFPEVPIETETSYHQPKDGSQTDPFSPLR